MRTGARKLNRQVQGTGPGELGADQDGDVAGREQAVDYTPGGETDSGRVIVVEVNWIRIAGELNETLDVVGCDDPFAAFHLAHLELMETFLAHGGPPL
jgi:hypothetical protein